MADNFYRALTKLIETNGGTLMRQARGSHEIWQMPDGKRATIPKPCRNRHTANGILKSLGIDAKL